MSKFNFPDPIATKIQTAIKNEILQNGKSQAYKIRKKLNDDSQINYDFSGNTQNNDSAFLSGSERIVNLTFPKQKYINEFGQNQTIEKFDLEICSISVSHQKRIVTTPLLNQKGSIKEIVGSNDYKINISGVLVAGFDVPNASNAINGKPEKQIKSLVDIAETNISVKVVSDYLNLFGVEYLMIQSFNFPQEFETKNLQRFSLSCVSDNPDLTIL